MNDKVSGYLILVSSLLGIACYFYLLFLSPWFWETLQVSAFVAVAGILAIIAWVGYTLATTPTPEPVKIYSEPPSEEEKEENAQI